MFCSLPIRLLLLSFLFACTLFSLCFVDVVIVIHVVVVVVRVVLVVFVALVVVVVAVAVVVVVACVVACALTCFCNCVFSPLSFFLFCFSLLSVLSFSFRLCFLCSFSLARLRSIMHHFLFVFMSCRCSRSCAHVLVWFGSEGWCIQVLRLAAQLHAIGNSSGALRHGSNNGIRQHHHSQQSRLNCQLFASESL